MNYTAGPWKTEYDAVIQTWDVHPDYLNLIGYFARIYKKQNQSINEHAANARLIAASPMMYETLIQAKGLMASGYNDEALKLIHKTLADIDAAIAKAE